MTKDNSENGLVLLANKNLLLGVGIVSLELVHDSLGLDSSLILYSTHFLSACVIPHNFHFHHFKI